MTRKGLLRILRNDIKSSPLALLAGKGIFLPDGAVPAASSLVPPPPVKAFYWILASREVSFTPSIPAPTTVLAHSKYAKNKKQNKKKLHKNSSQMKN